MSVFDHGQESGRGGMGRVVLIGAGVVALLVAGYFGATMMMPAKPSPEAPAPPVRSQPIARPVPKPVGPGVTAEESSAALLPRSKKAGPSATTPAPAAPAGPVLVVDSDVAGASVFVDRQYLGTTPLRSSDVAPGSHQLNASASGEDGLAQTIEIGETGETAIALKFREVRLNLQLAVIHRHTLGSCTGTLTATPAGISYQTENKKDAFAFPLRDLDVFEIDYLNKELKVKQRGGKTWNFTDKSENADKLFVFHRDVSKARKKLAAQAK